MNGQHLEHLRRIVGWLTAAVSAKYEAGQKEHSGNLWLKSGMLAHAEAEVLDLCVYIPTLREQLRSALALLEAGEVGHGIDALRAILGPAQE